MQPENNQKRLWVNTASRLLDALLNYTVIILITEYNGSHFSHLVTSGLMVSGKSSVIKIYDLYRQLLSLFCQITKLV